MKNNDVNRFDENRQMDDLFRSGLNDYQPEPSQDLWKGISRKLWWDELSHFMFTNLSSVLWIGGFAGLALIVSIIVIASIPQSAVTNGIFVQNLTGPANYLTPELQSAFSGTAQTNAVFTRNSKEEPQISETPSQSKNSVATRQTTPSSKPVLLEEHPYTPEPSLIETYNGTTIAQNARNSNFTDLLQPLASIGSPTVSLPDTLRIVTPTAVYNIPKTKPINPSFFSLYAGASPAYINYSGGEPSSETTLFGNVGVAYHRGWFSIRSGIGIGYVFSDGNYNIGYRSRDSVGYYNLVVGYAISQANPKEIVYITQRMIVYDSVDHQAQDQTSNRYPYVSVPLLLGFRVFETTRFGLTIETGPMVSFLIGGKEPQPVLNFENARITSVNETTPERNKTTWQLHAGVRFDYQFSKKFSLFAEPYYQYYFHRVSARTENTPENSYALGIGLGLQYYFGQKHP
jgi:hypothetical protein